MRNQESNNGMASPVAGNPVGCLPVLLAAASMQGESHTMKIYSIAIENFRGIRVATIVLPDHAEIPTITGRVVETGDAADVLDRPLHPYTAGLIGSVPSRNRRGQPLRQIPGMTPSLLSLPAGCAFRARCSRADTACEQQPPQTGSGHTARCFHPLLEPAA